MNSTLPQIAWDSSISWDSTNPRWVTGRVDGKERFTLMREPSRMVRKGGLRYNLRDVKTGLYGSFTLVNAKAKAESLLKV